MILKCNFFRLSLLAIILFSRNFLFAQCTAIINSSVNPPNGCSPFTLQLTDASTGIVTNRQWDFGDGSPQNSAQNPIHTFTKPTGNDTTYIVTLKIYCLGGDSSIATLNVKAFSPPPISFTADKLSFCALSDTICFNNTSEYSAGHTYLWNFGDNTSSSLRNPCKLYTNDGSYSIQLTVTDTNGCQQTITKTNYVTVKKAPTPDFSVTPQSGCHPLTVTITNTTNTTLDTIASWLWNFGDGTSSISQSPGVHTYTMAPDTPIVELYATNSLGCTNSTSKLLIIKRTPTAYFTMASEACGGIPTPITYTGLAGPSANYNWNFDGGIINSGAGKGPYSITWNTSGIKTVSLTVTEDGCINSYAQTIIINPQPSVTLASTALNDTICGGTLVVFTGSPSNFVNYKFYLNTSLVQSSAANTYSNSTLNNNDSVTVQVTDIKGCVSELSNVEKIKVKPLPIITLSLLSNDSLCEGDSASFSVAPTGLNGGYNFYDGYSLVQSGSSDSFKYSNSQNFTITAIGINDQCTSPPSNSIAVAVIDTLLRPQVNCGTTTDSTITFVWDSIYLAEGYQVSINAGAYIAPSSGSLGLSHLVNGLSLNDSLNIQVRVLGPSPCMDSIVSSTVTCYARTCDAISYSLTRSSSLCAGNVLSAQVNNILPPTYSISWNGGSFGSSKTFTLSPSSDTLINVSVNNTAQPSCPAVNKSIQVTVNPLPLVSVSGSVLSDSICLGEALLFTASPSNYDNYAFYNGYGLVQTGPVPSYTTIPISGSPVIRVIATNKGCTGTASDSVTYIVVPPLLAPQPTCGTTTDSTITFTWGNVTGATGYEVSINGAPYTLPSSGSAGLSHTITGLSPGASATIEVKAIGPLPCGNSSVSFAQTCYADPCNAISFSINPYLSLCEGQIASLAVSNINIPNYSISWNNGAYASVSTFTLLPASDTIISVSVKNLSQTGCPVATHYVDIHVIPLPVVTLSSSSFNDSSCANFPITFTANPQSYNSYTFYDNYAMVQSGGNPIYTTSSLINAHTIKVIVSNQGCLDTAINNINTTIIDPLSTPQVNCGTTTDSTITFVWDSVTGNNGYLVSINQGAYAIPSSGSGGLSHTITGFTPGDSISIQVIALGNLPCGNSSPSDTVTCYSMPCTGITYTLSGTDEMCETSTATAELSNIFPLTYNISWNGSTYGTQTTYSVTPVSSITLSVNVKNINEPGCPTVNKSLFINVIPTPTVSLSFNTINDSICYGYPLTVTASPATYDNYTFFHNGLSIQNSGNPEYANSSLSGINSFSVISNFSGCLDTSNNIAITVIDLPVLSYSTNAANDSVCEGTIYSLSVTPYNLVDYTFYLDGNIVQTSSSNIYSALMPDTGLHNITVIASDYLGCSNSIIDTLAFMVVPYTPVTLSANFSDTICNHQEVIFTATPTGLPLYTFYRNNVPIQSSSSNTYTFNNLLITDTISVIGQNALGCESIFSDSISYYVKPTADPDIAGADTIFYCITGSSAAVLTASVNNIYSPVVFHWNTGAQTSSISVSPTKNTLYTVYTTYKGCPSAIDSILVGIDTMPLPIVSAIPLLDTLCLGDSMLLQGSGNGLTFQWLAPGGIIISNQKTVYVSPIINTSYTFKSINLACATDTSISIIMDRCLTDLTGPVPQIITPNGDGANDYWIIPDIDYFTKNKVNIFNRWGQQVYAKSPYNNEWSGKYQDTEEDLPEGSYYYVIDLGEKKHTGFIIIYR